MTNDGDNELSFITPLDIEEYKQNDNLFRTEVNYSGNELLQRIRFDDVDTLINYQLATLNLSPVVFIDLGDVYKFLKVKNHPGLDPADISTICDIVCDFLGDEAEYHEALWNTFDEDVVATISAKLGSSEEAALSSAPFDEAMEVIVKIAQLIKNYLINAEYPLIETTSIYKHQGFKNGLLGLRLRSFEEIHEDYASS